MNLKLNKMALSVGLAISIVAVNASAQVLEEVIVTATKRAEGLQDVPIAISVMSGEAIEEKLLTNLEELTVYMPNVHISEASAGQTLFIRGVGSGVNYGFEQSVGMFIDGVYYGRGRSARGKFLDLERVEVLKGPQSTLFGKNTIAGAINITTAQPTEEFESYVDLSYRTELEGFGATAMVSGPLSDNLRGRLVTRKYDDKGYIDNLSAQGGDAPQQDDWLVRGSLVWDATDNLSFTLKGEHTVHDVLGIQDVISKAGPTATFFYQTYGDPDFQTGFDYTQYGQNVDGVGIFDDTDTNLLQLTAEIGLGEHSLKSITAYTDYEFTREENSDHSPLKLLNRGRTEEHQQISQELILSSPTGGFLEYLAGVYYQGEELSNNRHTIVAFSALPPVESAILAQIGNPPSGAIDGNERNFFSQDTDSWSVFAEATFNFTDVFRATLGLRYSDDEKSVHKRGYVENTNNILPDPLFEYLWAVPLNLLVVHEYALKRSEQHTTGHLTLQWDATDDAMVYFKAANGYKAGGFDENNSLGRLDVAEFEDETVWSYELGAKLTFADARARLNMAIFSSDFNDLQVSTFDGNATFIVGNAAESETQGFEADLEFAATDQLTLRAAVAYLDATYKSFKDAACTNDQLIDFINSGAPGGCTQDLSGKPLQFAPEYTVNVAADYRTSINDDLDMNLSLDYNWSDEYAVANDLDEHLIQGSFGKLNARIALTDSDHRWFVALVGKNLTNEKTFPWGQDVALGGLGFRSTYFKYIDPPRTFELNVRYSFY